MIYLLVGEKNMAKFKWYCNECDSTLLFEALVDEDKNVYTELDSCKCSDKKFEDGKKRKSCPNSDIVVEHPDNIATWKPVR